MTKYVYVVSLFDRWGYYYNDDKDKVFWDEELAEAC